jgi:hypothetical protein
VYTEHISYGRLPYKNTGVGVNKEPRNLFGIANSEVLLTRIILPTGAVLERMLVEGMGWWRVFLKGGRMETESSYCKMSNKKLFKYYGKFLHICRLGFRIGSMMKLCG